VANGSENTPARPFRAPFDDADQQREAATLGMWIFLITETLLFGGLFLSYTVMRHVYPEAFHQGSEKTEYWLGTINTGVLLTSSLTMALAVHWSEEGKRRATVLFLLTTFVLGIVFLALKFTEYHSDFQKHYFPNASFDYSAFSGPQARYVPLFFTMYFLMTGLHAIHMTIGLTLITVMTVLALRGHFTKGNATPVALTGLFWHLIDVVWVFLYPLLYLIGGGRHG
jgi:cytochrome c oxidase subunit 3